MFEKLPKNREFFYHSFLKNKSFGQQIGFTFAVSKQMEKAVQYETVIGLEVHARLNTKSKLFSGDAVAFGAEPNTNISPIVLAHPGTLPKMNKKAIEYAVKMGLACHCEIAKENWFARKNYFYPDLPKGYQVSQHTTPICIGGYISIRTQAGKREIKLNRIHLEEDAGRSIHDADDENTCIDYNRAGAPLIEIVTEPDLQSGDEAYSYLTEIRKLVRYLDICDGNMEEGSLRCDANISVRKKGDSKLGTKVEVKNLNSIRNVKRAIEAEAVRLIEILESGGQILQQTRSYDAGSNTTFAIRDKEDADDYRYFPEPDLTPFHLTEAFIENIKNQIPALPEEKAQHYISSFQLSDADAHWLAGEKNIAAYFETVTKNTGNYKAAANWIQGPIQPWMNENGNEISTFPLAPAAIAQLIQIIDDGQISFSAASGKLFDALIKSPETEPGLLAEKLDLLQQSNVDELTPVVDKVLNKFSDKVIEYQKGKKGLLALFTGEVMKLTKGKADPKMVTKILNEKLKK